MAIIADILLIAGAFGAAFYCIVLSKRLNRFRSLENGVGEAVAGLSLQVTQMAQALEETKSEAQSSSVALDKSAERAESVARRLELLLASMHDLPNERDQTASSLSNPAPLKFRRRLSEN